MQNKRNTGVALITSLLIMAAGAVIAGLLYYYNVFSAWVVLIATVAAGACYRAFCLKQGTLYYIWMTILSVGLNVASICLTLIVSYQNKFGVPFDVASKAFNDMVADNLSSFIINIVFSGVFTAAGIIIVLMFNKRSQNKASQSTPQVEERASESAQEQPISEQPVAEEYVKIAEFCLKNFVEFIHIQDPQLRTVEIDNFRKKYLARFDANIAQNVKAALRKKALSQEEETAFKLLDMYI